MPKEKKVEIEHEVDKYTIGLFSRTQTPDPKDIAIITLWEGDKIRGYMNFFPNNAALPNPSLDKESNVIRFYFHIDHFDVISDMLRSEKPLFIEYRSPPPFATFRSGKEPIGEEETLFYPRE